MPPTTSSTPDAPDLESSGLSISAHLDKWDDYAQVALKALLSFHGAHPSNKADIPEFVAEIADQMLAQRAARMSAHRDAKEAEKQAAVKKPKAAK